MRIIARLDIKLNKLIKSIMYEGVRQVGNPEEFAQNYYTSGIDELLTSKRVLIKIVDILGRNVKLPLEKNRTLFYIYENGTVEKKMLIE